MKNIITTVMVLLMPILACAHGYWIETTGSGKKGDTLTVKLYFGDYPAGERMTGKSLDKMKDIDVFVTAPDGKREKLVMQQGNEYWVGHCVAVQKGMYAITGINDTRAVQDWSKHNLGITRPVQYLKAWYSVGKSTAKNATALALDLTVDHLGKDNYALTVYKDGVAFAQSEVIFAPYGKPEDILKTDAKGRAYFTTAEDGLYIISADWIDKTPGTFNGKEYESVRHRLDYSFYKE